MKISPFVSLPSIQTHFTSPTLFAFSYHPLFKPYIGVLITAAVYDNHSTLTLVTDRKLSLVSATGTFTTGRPPRTVLFLHIVFKENFPIATLQVPTAISVITQDAHSYLGFLQISLEATPKISDTPAWTVASCLGLTVFLGRPFNLLLPWITCSHTLSSQTLAYFFLWMEHILLKSLRKVTCGLACVKNILLNSDNWGKMAQ